MAIRNYEFHGNKELCRNLSYHSHSYTHCLSRAFDHQVYVKQYLKTLTIKDNYSGSENLSQCSHNVL